MLDELSVANLGIIESATIEPGPGLVAVTGETGAGKTLLLGALRMLRGDSTRNDRIGPHGDDARVEGRFVFDDEEVVAARSLGSNRSRAYLDGAMVPAKNLAERFENLVEIVAQHEHVTLGRESSLRRVVDGLLAAGDEDLKAAYISAYRTLADLEAEAAELGGDERTLAREMDLLRHQANEIDAAAPTTAEETELTSRLRRLRHAGEIAASMSQALDSLDEEGNANDLLRSALDDLRAAAKLDPELDTLARRLESSIADAESIAADTRDALALLDLDPGAATSAEERAAVFADLKRKYGASIDEVLQYGADAAERAAALEYSLGRVESISAEIAAARQVAVDAGRALADARRRAGSALIDKAVEILVGLGFRSPLLELRIAEAEPGPAGADRIELAFASDTSLTPGPVAKVASGGELSRLVLAIRVAAGVADAPIVAFDEVDAGVGGSTALAMGEQLAALAGTGQVLVVTHLPQVAAFADRHFVVDRSGPTATVRQVDGPERLAELARMLGGMEESERGKLHAEELLELAAARRSA